MNFQSMDYFIMVAKERSFTKAADTLHVTQQTLSAHIASIERELNCQLLLRHIPLEMTYAGELFLRYAVDFQNRFRMMEREFSEIVREQKGRLRIGIAYTRGHAIMPGLIQQFQTRYPLVQIQTVEESNDALRAKLLAGEVDLVIANFPERTPGITLKDFYEEEVVLFLESALADRLYGPNTDEVLDQLSHCQDLTPLASCPFLLNSEKDIAGRIGRYFIGLGGFQPAIKAESENVETLLDLCVRGVGACFCPENLAESTLSPAQLSRLKRIRFDQNARYMIRFGWLEQPYQWNMISKFVELASALSRE